jgi:hypothetical protein
MVSLLCVHCENEKEEVGEGTRRVRGIENASRWRYITYLVVQLCFVRYPVTRDLWICSLLLYRFWLVGKGSWSVPIESGRIKL